jgi:hypothetical protein
MKKLLLLFTTLIMAITLSSCATEETEFTLIVYGDDPSLTLTNLGDLPTLIMEQLVRLGYEYDRVVVESTNDLSATITKLNNDEAQAAVLASTLLNGSEPIKRILSSTFKEYNYELDQYVYDTSYHSVIVSADTTLGNSFKDYYTTFDFTGTTAFDQSLLNPLTVCVGDTEDSLETFTDFLGVTNYSTVLWTVDDTSDVFESLEDGSCDLGLVRQEDISLNQLVWALNDHSIFESLTELYQYDSVLYNGIYVSNSLDVLVQNSIAQVFIQMSANRLNEDVLDTLGAQGYKIVK